MTNDQAAKNPHGSSTMTNPDRFLEDVPVGGVSTQGPIMVTEEEIIAFGRAYDLQPFHTDPVAAAKSPPGSLIASGWHIAALVMRRESPVPRRSSAWGRGTAMAASGAAGR
jgi:acyl dehydratase